MASRDYYEGLDQPVTFDEWLCGITILLFLSLLVIAPIAVFALLIMSM
jgi:hypothetical protein